MNTQPSLSNQAERYELRFESLFDDGRAIAFECDAGGHVDLDALTERASINYLYARTVIGRDFAMPRVEPRSTDFSLTFCLAPPLFASPVQKSGALGRRLSWPAAAPRFRCSAPPPTWY